MKQKKRIVVTTAYTDNLPENFRNCIIDLQKIYNSIPIEYKDSAEIEFNSLFECDIEFTISYIREETDEEYEDRLSVKNRFEIKQKELKLLKELKERYER